MNEYEEYTKMMNKNNQNIYTRIGDCLSSTIVDSVLAYNNEEEELLLGAGFTRTSSVFIENEIVDVYSKVKTTGWRMILDDGEITITSGNEVKVKTSNVTFDVPKITYSDTLVLNGAKSYESSHPYLTNWKITK